MKEKYKIAGVVFDAEYSYAYTAHLCKNYIYRGEEPCSFSISVTKEDISLEVAESPEVNYPEYLEGIALYRKFLKRLIDFDGIVIHSSAVAVDGKAYLFTAPSGTGKSTHTALWRKMLGDRAVMVNDDKPIIRFIDGEFFVFGTPWNGKHSLDTNCTAKLKAICELTRGEQNSIEKLPKEEVLPLLLKQTLRPSDLADFDKLLSLLNKLIVKADFYKLKCNMDISSAQLSFGEMSKEN